jgi:hypothetical protein
MDARPRPVEEQFQVLYQTVMSLLDFSPFEVFAGDEVHSFVVWQVLMASRALSSLRVNVETQCPMDRHSLWPNLTAPRFGIPKARIARGCKHAWSLQESYAVVCVYVFVGVFVRGIGPDDDRPPLANVN